MHMHEVVCMHSSAASPVAWLFTQGRLSASQVLQSRQANSWRVEYVQHSDLSQAVILLFIAKQSLLLLYVMFIYVYICLSLFIWQDFLHPFCRVPVFVEALATTHHSLYKLQP